MASDRAKRELAAWVRQGQTESCLYRPGRDDLPQRTIAVTVDRGGPEPFGQGQAPGFAVTVLNDATDGIPAATLDVGADRIDVAERVGGTPSPRGVQRIASQDADWLVLDVM